MMNDYDVNVLLTVSKRYRIQAENERAAKVAGKLLFDKEGDEGVTVDDVVHTFVSARPATKPLEDKNASNDAEEYETPESFKKFREAVFDFMRKKDDSPSMAEDIIECFDYEVEDFDPFELFYWKDLYEVENRFRKDKPFFAQHPLGVHATLIDYRYTHEEESRESDCTAGTGYELWMDDQFRFFTVRFTELVERDADDKQLMAMRYRQLSDDDFYDRNNPFLSEDFLDNIVDKINAAEEDAD